MWNRKNEGNYLGQILLEQEADSKKKRRDKNATQSSKWNLVLPQNYERILQRFWGTSEFGELLEALTREQRKRMYESISDAMLEKVFCEVPDVVQERIAECSYERLERFFNEASISQAYPVFMLADFDLQCLVVTDMLSQESLMAYARYGSANEDKESFLRVIEKIYIEKVYVEGRIQRKRFNRKLALMPAEWIAKLLEECHPEFACAILKEMEAEHKHETFQAIRKEALYTVLRRCNILLFDFDTDVSLKIVEDLEPMLYRSIIEQIVGATPDLIIRILGMAQLKMAQDILLAMKQEEIEAIYEMTSDQNVLEIIEDEIRQRRKREQMLYGKLKADKE